MPNTIFLDIETTGLNPFKDTIRCIAYQINDGPIYCFTPDDDDELNNFKAYLQNLDSLYIGGHNIGFDIKFLFQAGIIKKIPSLYIDTKLLYHSTNPHESLKLKDLAEKYLGVQPIRYKDLLKTGQGSKKKKLKPSEIPMDELMEYCKSDVIFSRQLYERHSFYKQLGELKAT